MEEIIIEDIDAHECKFYHNGFCDCNTKKHTASCDNKMQYEERIACGQNPNCYFKQLKQKEKEIEELHERTAQIIHRITGGRLSYSTYTLEAVEQAYYDQLEIDVEKRTKELEKENEELKKKCDNYSSLIWYIYCGSEDNVAEHIISEYYQCLNELDERYIKNFWKKIENLEQTDGRIKINKYKQAIDKIKEKLNLVNEIYSNIHDYRINDLKCGVLTLSKEILQIINEVEE